MTEIPTLNIGRVMDEAFGRCPECRTKLVAGQWLKWCPSRLCAQTIKPGGKTRKL